MKELSTVRQYASGFLDAYLLRGDERTALDCLSPDIYWSETPERGAVSGRENVAELLRRELEHRGSYTELTYESLSDFTVAPGVSVVNAATRLYGDTGIRRAVWHITVREDGDSFRIVSVIGSGAGDDRHDERLDRLEKSYNTLSSSYNVLLSHIPGGVAVLRAEENGGLSVEYISDGFCKMTGYDRDGFTALYGGDVFMNICADDRPRVRKKCADAVEHGLPMYDEHRLITADGSLIWVRAASEIIPDRQGLPCIYAVYSNINDLKRREAELIKSREMLEAALDHAGMYYWEYDVKNDRLHSSPKGVRELGVPECMDDFPRAFVGLGFVHPDSAGDYLSMHEELKQGRALVQRRICYIFSGREVWHQVRYTNRFDSDGKPGTAFATSHDASELVRLEKQFSLAAEQEGFEVYELSIAQRRQTRVSRGVGNDIIQYPADCTGIHPEDADVYLDVYDRIYSGARRATCRVRKIDPHNGKWSWYSVSITSAFDYGGRPVSAVVTMKDINAQIEAQGKYELLIRYNSLAYRNSIAVFRLNLTQNVCESVRSGNEKLLRLAEQGTASGLFSLYSAGIATQEERQRFRATFNCRCLRESFTQGNTSVSMEHRIPLRQDGSLMWLRSVADIIENPGTHDLEAFFYVLDIDRERMLATVTERLFGTDYEFVATVNIRNGSVEVWGDKTDTAPGRNTGDYISCCRDILRIGRDESSEWLEKLKPDYVAERLRDRSIYSITCPVRGRDGETEYKCWKLLYLDDGRQHLIAAVNDVTETYGEEQRQKEKLSGALSEAERANKAKSNFLSRMSHDMRTPMNGILGMVNLMHGEKLSDEAASILSKMEVSCKYLLSLINDTLDMSKIESNRITLRPEIIDSSNILASVLATIKPSIDEKKIQFDCRFSDAPIEPVKADPVRLQQIFINILSNAVKFTPAGGRISFEMERVSSDDKYICDKISIRDNGIGMSEEFLPHIFEPYSQEHSSITTPYAGSGLGMPIVKNLVELMGGSIEIGSRLGEGTEVCVRLNFERAGSDTAGTGAKERPYSETGTVKEDIPLTILHGKRILLCEDNMLNTEIAVRLLETQGCIVECAENGRRGVELFGISEEYYYDAVLMDIRMPVMDGIRACRAIRALDRPDASAVPIIAMTANAFDDDVNATREAGMNAHLAKPVEPVLLFGTLAEILALREKRE